jgi:kynurenine formamidase
MHTIFKDSKIIDLTHSLNSHVPCWGGGCGFSHTLRDDYDPSAPFKFRTYDMKMQAGIGTHMDAPAHCIPGGKGISDIELKNFFAPCHVINISPKAHEAYSLSVADIEAFEAQYGEIVPGSFVIIYTGWDQYWNDPIRYRNNLAFPDISKEAAQVFLRRKIFGLGIDTLSPDRPEGGFHVHQLLLEENKYIIENVANASKLPAVGAYTIVLPMKIENGTEAPVRLVGIYKE